MSYIETHSLSLKSVGIWKYAKNLCFSCMQLYSIIIQLSLQAPSFFVQAQNSIKEKNKGAHRLRWTMTKNFSISYGVHRTKGFSQLQLFREGENVADRLSWILAIIEFCACTKNEGVHRLSWIMTEYCACMKKKVFCILWYSNCFERDKVFVKLAQRLHWILTLWLYFVHARKTKEFRD